MPRSSASRGTCTWRDIPSAFGWLDAQALQGIVVEMLAERYPDLYAGALPMSGVIGGTKLEVDYIANVRVLFDLFYPGILPGNVEAIPPGTDPLQGIALPAIGDDLDDGVDVALVMKLELTRGARGLELE